MAAPDGTATGLPSSLPSSLAEIAEVIGIEAALILARDFGGGELYIPTRLGPDHPIARSVGARAAEALAEHYAVAGKGAQIEIPNAKRVRALRQYPAIRDAVANGASKQRVARDYGLTTRMVRLICNDPAPWNTGQQSLF